MGSSNFKSGVRVRTKDDRVGVVIETDGDAAEIMFPEGEEWITLVDLVPARPRPIEELIEFFAYTSPGEKGGADWDNATEFGLHQQASFLRHVLHFDPLAGLTNARIEPKAHQVSIARTVVQKRQARMILADEVGLGKTIEAGLILKELRARGLAERVLVICPASLQMQWQSELLTKFNEPFEIIDGPFAKHLSKNSKNPFSQKDFIICSLPFAAKDSRAEQIIEAGWDLVIFDEAHRVRRWLPTPGRPKTTKAYELAEALEPHTPALLMLTATPMQLNPYELYSLIQLVEPGIFTSHSAYLARSKQLPMLNELMRSLTGWAAIGNEEKEQTVTDLGAFLENEALTSSELDQPERREALMDDLVNLHPLAGVMVRNRKVEIGGFMGREAAQYGIKMLDDEHHLYAEIESYLQSTYSWASEDSSRNAIGFLMVRYSKMLASSPAAIYSGIGNRLAKLHEKLENSEESRTVKFNEEILRDLGDEGDHSNLLDAFVPEILEQDIAALQVLHDKLANASDSKLAKFLEVVEEIRAQEPDTKIVIFTEFRATQKYLADNLGNHGFSVSRFTGSLSLEEKEQAIREFRDSAQILVSTEAGGEGRNLQFASILINYDLPWNPMKVEQRIGRLDRIGQKKKVRVLNLFRYETVEERVHEVLSQRIQLFEESVGSLEAILGGIEKEIEALFFSTDTNANTETERSIESQVAAARETERLMSDLALDRSSFRRDQTNALLEEDPMATHDDLQRFVSDALEYFGGTLQEHDDGGQVISLSPNLTTDLELPFGQQRGVFKPQLALEREDLSFFALGNTWVNAIVKHASAENRSVATVHLVPNGPDAPELEVVYEFRSTGRSSLGEIVVHRVGPDLKVVDSDMKKMPPIGQSTQVECPDWLKEANQASERRMQEQLADFRERVLAADESLSVEDLERNERAAIYRRQRFVDRIKEHQEWITQVEKTGTDGQKKILPARRGRLEKDRERLERIDAEAEKERQKIMNQASTPSSKTWSVALVVGQ
jgi:SNF2 family DNA or RNA helicase